MDGYTSESPCRTKETTYPLGIFHLRYTKRMTVGYLSIRIA